MKKAIFKLYVECGRMGTLEGVFISTKEKVDKLIESKIEVYFGEVLGKHSEIYGSIEKDDIIFISDNKEAVDIIEKYNLCSGYDPFAYTSTNFSLDDIECSDIYDMTIDEIIDVLLKK